MNYDAFAFVFANRNLSHYHYLIMSFSQILISPTGGHADFMQYYLCSENKII